MERKSSHEPPFEPDVITMLDWLNKQIRKRFFSQIHDHRGWKFLLVASMLLAYWYPY